MRTKFSKSQPTPSDVHVDAALTDISIAYAQEEVRFIANRVFPAVPVNHQTNKFHKFDKNDWFRDDAVTKRAPGSESSGSGFGLSTGSYSCDVWATHIDIDDQVRGNSDPSVPVDDAAAKLVTQRMMIRRERQFASDYFNTGVWATDKVGVTDFSQWDDGSSDPENDIDTAGETILQNTGFLPNTLVVQMQVHNALKRHPLIKDRFKYTSGNSITPDMIAAFLGIDNYIVGMAAYATNNEDGTETYAFAMGKNALLCYVTPTPGIMVPSAGYNFVWNGLTGMNDLGIAISNIDLRNAGKKVDRVEGEFAFDLNPVATDLGYFFSAAIS